MAFGFRQSDDVATLIARKSYSKAIEVIKSQLQAGRPDDRLRLQLADVLVLAGKGREAAAILEPLADEYAREGFAAKAVSVLKKIQKADPGRRGLEAKLAALIEARQQATVSVAPRGMPEIGMEEIGADEIGFEPAADRPPLSVPAEPGSVPEAAAAPPEEPAILPGGTRTGEEIDLEPAPLAEPVLEPAAKEPGSAPRAVPDRDWFLGEPEEAGLELEEPEAEVEPAVEIEPELPAEIEAEPLVDAEPLVEAEPLAEESRDPMSDAAFAEELSSLLDQVLGGGAAPAAPEAPRAGSQMVVSPLFESLAVDEMVAVIQGLHLLTFEPRQFILREGEAGEALYMLTSGTVRAFRKNAAGKQVALGELKEGAFFGEGSILTGRPRTASVVAWTRCELLELDRPTLDSIVAAHPRVREVLEEFAARRARGRP